MMTTYILPFESRITVAVPVCNPNTWSHRVHANLATDHEQVFFGAFTAGIDPRGDPLFAHVPRPLLINATTDDTLNPPSGVWNLSTWLYKAYAAHRAPHAFQSKFFLYAAGDAILSQPQNGSPRHPRACGRSRHLPRGLSAGNHSGFQRCVLGSSSDSFRRCGDRVDHTQASGKPQT